MFPTYEYYESKHMQELSEMRRLALRWKKEVTKNKSKRILKDHVPLTLNAGPLSGRSSTGSGRHALEIIHEVGVWEEILSYITDPVDILSSYYVCNVFRDIMAKQRVRVLFPKALEILKSNNYLHCDNPGDQRSILTLRQSSKSLKELVDNVYFRASYEADDWFINYDTAAPIRNPIRNKQKIEQILSSLPTTPEKVLFTREVTICDPFFIDEATLNEFYSAFTSLLETCGESIWALKYHTRRPFSVVNNRVREWCNFLPNLKSLTIKNLRGFNEDDAYIDDDMRRENALLEAAMREVPFPFIPFLVHLVACDIPGSLSSAILRANIMTIRSLTVSEVNLEMSRIIESLDLEQFSVLKCHSISLFYIMTGDFHWPVNKICLRYNNRELHPFQSPPLFALLNKFGKTLIYLEVNLDLADEALGQYLDMPNLKKLKWRLNSHLQSIDFIAPLHSLEELYLAFEDYQIFEGEYETEKEEDIIELRSKFNDFYKSNVWEYFPTLKRVGFLDLQGNERSIFTKDKRCIQGVESGLEKDVF